MILGAINGSARLTRTMNPSTSFAQTLIDRAARSMDFAYDTNNYEN